jgi:hypothetical protein
MKRLPVAGRPPATGASVLPPLYARWIDDLLGAPIEPETNATCADCAMGAPANAPPDPEAVYFNPRVKCCTFVPVLPSFLVGRILRDHAPEQAQGRASVEARIATGIGLTPLGLGRSPAQHVPDAGFGRDEKYLCPHFVQQDGGICSIWHHREAVCTTFFCKFVRGAVGASFWSALRRLLEAIEQALAWQCVETLDVGAAAVSLLLGAAGDARHDTVALRQDGTYAPDDLRAIWGHWAGRERAFYEAAAGVVESLSWREIIERAGPQVRLRATLVREAHARLRAPAIPVGPLRRSPFVATTLDPTTVRLTTYSGMDPITIPRALFDALSHFDERAAEPAIAAIEAEQGLEIDLDVVGRLVDFEVLVPAQKTTSSAPESSAAPDPS